MVSEKSVDSKAPLLSNEAPQPERVEDKQPSSLETSKSKRKQTKSKRRASEKTDTDNTKSSSVDVGSPVDNSSYSGDMLSSTPDNPDSPEDLASNIDVPASPSPIEPSKSGDSNGELISQYTSPSVEESHHEKVATNLDIINNPLNLLPLAISASPLPPMNTAAFQAPQENFLELLVQAAFSQEANAPVNAPTEVSPPSTELARTDLENGAGNITPMLLSNVPQTTELHDVYSYTPNQPGGNYSNPPLDNISSNGGLPHDHPSTCDVYRRSHTSRDAKTLETTIPYDTKVLPIADVAITHGAGTGPPPYTSTELSSQRISAKPTLLSSPARDGTDMLATLCAASENNPSSIKEIPLDWPQGNSSASTPPIPVFSQTPSGALHTTNSHIRDNPLCRPCQDHTVINAFQMQHKISSQRKSQPIQQLQLLQLQPLPTDIAQISP
ncbi:hypothetical protein K493DRAFT_320292 [Basidiobolus meristosporus CBS 931.73]|uniref:Uncharacterized protein n=1 Tax=Basidiobolus meristosporus CBS 931.73 TaxID=1314790 RepID=A0A1Y1XBU8_9FUNG|nr:hypothetical protein K493DRAFT_320292 [Basidiobolus meristosporus CBS 931.73]|eukprot:ORX83193.1 hypothetical protein K493DRAFT_320292 [Basidiobolus meristosporus CBS 931.73]